MKSVKKFSAISAKDQPITESAKVSKEAVDELIKKIGFNSIEELKNEKDLLSKLEALSKSFATKDNISEEGDDTAEEIEDEEVVLGEPKSAEGEGDQKTSDEETVAVEDEIEEDAEELEDEEAKTGDTESLEGEDDLVSSDQEITKEVPAEADEVEDEDGVDVASEEKETPKATRRIMAFEDFIKEKETTINKNVNYHDDDEEPEDYAVPMAASADPLAESAESRGKDDEKEGDELEDKGDKKVDSEDDKEKADHYKGAVKSDDAQIKSLKKDAKFDKEEEEDAEKNESAIMSFANFVNEAYDKVVWGGNKGDDSETEEDEEDYEDKKDEAYDVVTLGGNKGDKSKTKKGEEDYEDDDKKDEKFDTVVLGGNKGDKSKTKKGEEDYEDSEEVDEATVVIDATDPKSKILKKLLKKHNVKLKVINKVGPGGGNPEVELTGDKKDLQAVLHSGDGWGTEDLDNFIKESNGTFTVKVKSLVEGVGEVINKVEGDELRDQEVGADGIAIPVIKGDGPETAAGIAGDTMNMGKVKSMSSLDGKLVTPDQTITKVIPDEANDVSEDGIEIPLVKEAKLNEKDITSDDQFKEYAMKMLKDAFGDDFDEAKATDVADGLIKKYAGDYGAMVGALQSTMGS